MNKSEKIIKETGITRIEKYINVKLENETDTFEVLSLRIDTREAYRDFDADYGVLVGRVLANDGIGIPNVKVSVFIPLAEEDESDGSIASIYPYKSPRDKDNNGKRYNLLPRVGTVDPDTGVISPKQPFGSFLIKPEIVTNLAFLNVYKKYYKYTAVTNEFGDYMIFGAPTGTQIVHMSADITDIGKYSMDPAAMVTNLGYSPNLFTDNSTKIKPSKDLDDLPNIETQDVSVDIIPFWGDEETFEIGITRQDFRIRAQLQNTFTIFGTAFTDGDECLWGDDYLTTGLNQRQIVELYRAGKNANQMVSLSSKRIGQITEKIYYYPNTITDEEINDTNVDLTEKMLVLDPTEYSSYKRDGDFVFIINCNRKRIVTGNSGEDIVVDNDSTAGVFTEFKGFVTLEITEDSVPMNFTSSIGNDTKLIPIRYKLKFPQNAPLGLSFDQNTVEYNKTWRRGYKTFTADSYYSFSKFHSIIFNSETTDHDQDWNGFGLFNPDRLNDPYQRDSFNTVGIIITETFNDGSGTNYQNSDFELQPNTAVNIGSNSYLAFGANWLNLAVHLPQVGYMDDGYEHTDEVRINTNFHEQHRDNNSYNRHFLHNNEDPIGATDFNTKWFARNDIHWTDIINVPIEDIVTMKETTTKGFTDLQAADTLVGTEYRYGETDSPNFWVGSTPATDRAGRINGNIYADYDPRKYFYKGFGEANVINYLYELGIVK